MVLKLLLRAVVLACLFTAGAQAADRHVLKFATLAPQGSTWMNILEDWSKEVERESAGRVSFKFYPGGVAGDEPDVLRKIRFGQLHGGAFSGYAIGQVYSPARVLEIPFLFRDVDEVDFVRSHFNEDIAQGFRDNGFEQLGWMEIGFVYFFSTSEIHSLADLRKRRIWLWQGDQLGQAFFKASDISPIPLSITDVFTSLSTGLIDTVYSTPLAAIAMQWFTKTQYMSDVPMTNAMGALLVSNKFFDGLPQDLQAILKRTGQTTGERLIAETRADNDKSMAVLDQQGLKKVFTSQDVSEAELFDIRDRAAADLTKSGYIPEAVYSKTRSLLESYRSGHAQPAEQAKAP